MAKKTIGQLRYYGDKKAENYPSTLSQYTLTQNVFELLSPVTRLGIQTLPGTKVYINENPNPIIIGQTGIYELDIESSGSIFSLVIDRKSLNTIQNSPSAYLIIDYISEREAG